MAIETGEEKISPFQLEVYSKLAMLQEVPKQIEYLTQILGEPNISEQDKEFVQRQLDILRTPKLDSHAGEFKNSMPN